MSKKIISIILTIAMILCQGTLCLGTVSATSNEYIIEPDYIELSLEASDWAPSSVTLENDAEGNLVFIDNGHKNDVKERYDTGWMELKELDIPAGNYFSIELVARVDEAYPARRYNGDIWTSGNDTRPQFYYGGTKPNGDAMNFNEGNSTAEKMGKYIVSGSSTSGYYGTKFETYTCELSGSWADMKTLTKIRFDANKNSTGRVTIKSIKLIGRPGIKSIGFNSAYDAELDAVPVDPDTIDITMAGSVHSIEGAVTITDPDGNEVPLAGTTLIGGKAVLALADGVEFQEFTTYTVTFDENTMITANHNLQESISFSFTTDDSKAPSIFDAVDPNRPSDFTDDNIIWSAEFKSNDDLDYFKSGSGIKTEIAYGEYLKYTSQSPIINTNKNLQGYYIDTKFGTPVDANMINTLQFRMKIVNAVVDGKITGTVNGETITKDRVPPNFVMYFAGVNDDGSSFVMNGSHSHSASYKILKDDEGNGYTEWAVYEYNLNSIKSWVAARDITSIRFDFSNNCESELLVDYVRLIGPKMPEIEEVKYNTELAVDEVQGLPVNPETVDLQLTAPLFEIGANGVVFEDEYGNTVDIEKVSLLNEAKTVSIKLAQELNPYTLYYIGINENAKIGASLNINTPVIAEISTGNHRVKSMIEIIDPERPDDSIPVGEEVYSLDFHDKIGEDGEYIKKAEDDLKFFKSTSNVKTSLKYGEYMEYKTESLGIGGTSGLPASYYIDSDFSNDMIDADKYYRLQIRMKVEKQVLGSGDGYFKMYFKGDNSVNMKEDNTEPVTYAYRTDEEGNYGTDWFTVDVDLSKSTAWKTASNITSIRFDFLKNVAGTVLVDYIRFIALPAVTEASYTDNNGSVVIEDGVTVPANAKFINLKISRPLPGGLKYSMVNEFGNEASIDMANTEYVASESTIKVALASELETSSTYTLAIDSSTDFAQSDVKTVQKLYKPIEYKFDVQPAPIDATITKDTDSSVVDYTNNTGDDIVLVAIATIWNGNTYVSKNMVVTPVLANSSVNGVVVNHPITGNNKAELVVMQYDAEKGKYTMISKMVY